MTIQGARDELINMMECKDIPFYFVPILQKVVETIEMEIATISDIEQIRDEIADLDDAEYEFEGYYKAVNDALQIIDKYREEQTDAT